MLEKARSSYCSFDREFWHYNTVDFSCARKQEAVLTLTLLYSIKHDKNRYYQSREMFDYIRAALRFWTTIQNRNGSFNEWYPSEHSFVVTSFSTYAVSESLLLIKDELPQDECESIVGALVKAGTWLISRNETRVMNQQTGAAIALYNLYLLTDNTQYRDSSREKITLLLLFIASNISIGYFRSKTISASLFIFHSTSTLSTEAEYVFSNRVPFMST